MDKKISEKNTKKELWDAYQELLHGQQEAGSHGDQKQSAQDTSTGDKSPQLQHIASRIPLSAAPILQEIDILRRSVGDILEHFGEQAVSFEKRAREEEERLGIEIQRKRTEWKREQELYDYDREMKRRRDDDEYSLKTSERERQFNERFTAKEKDLREREEQIKVTEEEIKQLRAQVEQFPKELDQAVVKAISETQSTMRAEAATGRNLASKDTEREQEIAKLKIQSLEDTIKRQQTQITTLERELTRAHEQIQKLAVTVIEGRAPSSRTEEYQHTPLPPQESSLEKRKS